MDKMKILINDFFLIIIFFLSLFCLKLIRFESVNANAWIKLSINPEMSDEYNIWGIL